MSGNDNNERFVPISDFYVPDPCVFTPRIFSMMLNRAKQCLHSLLPGEEGVCWTMSMKPWQRRHIPADDARMTVEFASNGTQIVVFLRKARTEDDFNFAMLAEHVPGMMLLGTIDQATKLKAAGKRRFAVGN